MAAFSVSGLCVDIGKRTVLDHVSIDVGPGELVGLLGPNGSGKSTLLATLAGLRLSRAGTISRAGVPVSTRSAQWRGRLAFVFQSPAIDKRLTVRHNLELAARLQGHGGRGLRDAVEAGLADARLEDRGHEPASTLSGGMLRRLDIARALIGSPELVLLDEPTTGVDEASFRDLWARLDRYRLERGAAMLLATHRSDEAERCDRVATMRSGRVTRVASPSALIGEIAEDSVLIELREECDVTAALGRWWSESAEVRGRTVDLRITDAPAAIAPIIAAIGPDRIVSVSMRRPSMADAFARATGGRLEESR